MGDLVDDDVIPLVRKYALQNALEYDGKGQVGSTLGRLLSERQDLRPKAKDLMSLVSKEVEDANNSMIENGADYVRREIENIDPRAVNRVRQEKNAGLKPLENTEDGVVLRFAPNPNGPLSLGHSRGIVINNHYAVRYKGKIVLRFDDTDTVVKPPLIEAYEWIIEDFEWLTGSKPDITIKASERMPIYLEYADKLLSEGYGYVCECSSDDFKKHRISMAPCPHRNRPTQENMELWNIIQKGGMKPGDAIIRVKTDMTLPNPALRDWPAWRIQKNIHPLVGGLYNVWPLLDFQSAIEDHEQGVTHIIRGKDLMDSTRKQILLYNHFGWTYPETLYWGRVSVHDQGSFSTSTMREDIDSGVYNGWDDPRLPTLMSMRKRGYDPEAITSFWTEMGITQKDVAISLESLNAVNSAKIDPTSRRISVILDPVEIEITGDVPKKAVLPSHPDDASLGNRVHSTKMGRFIIERLDQEDKIRLKDFADIENIDDNYHIVSTKKSDDRKIINWISAESVRDCTLVIPDGPDLSRKSCLVENAELIVGEVIQMERSGFAKVMEWSDDSRVLHWLHR